MEPMTSTCIPTTQIPTTCIPTTRVATARTATARSARRAPQTDRGLARRLLAGLAGWARSVPARLDRSGRPATTTISQLTIESIEHFPGIHR